MPVAPCAGQSLGKRMVTRLSWRLECEEGVTQQAMQQWSEASVQRLATARRWKLLAKRLQVLPELA